MRYIHRFAFVFTLLLLTITLSARKFDVVRFGLCTDIHLPTMHDSEYRIRTFIDSMNIANPDFIIELGDFGTPEQKYAYMFDIWNSFKGEKYHVIGNHEMDGGYSLEQALVGRPLSLGSWLSGSPEKIYETCNYREIPEFYP